MQNGYLTVTTSDGHTIAVTLNIDHATKAALLLTVDRTSVSLDLTDQPTNREIANLLHFIGSGLRAGDSAVRPA